MKETGINVVQIGEFAWSTLEQKQGNIDISFFVNKRIARKLCHATSQWILKG